MRDKDISKKGSCAESLSGDGLHGLLSFILSFRLLILIIFLILTGFFGYKCIGLKLYDDPNKWPPKHNKKVLINDYLQEKFGGANRIMVQIRVKEGDIFNPQTLTKVKTITDEIRLIEGALPYCIYSLSDLKVKYMKGTEDSLVVRPLLDPFPDTPQLMEEVKYGVYHDPLVYGSLVSMEAKSTIIVADFRTGEEGEFPNLPKTDPVAIFSQIDSIVKNARDANHVITYTGSPIIIGWVNKEGLPLILTAFLIFLAVMAVILWFAYKKLRGVIFSLLLGLGICVWAFGLYAIFVGEILRSSSVFLVPFVLMAATACHSVQFLKRFFEDEYIGDKEGGVAIIVTAKALFLPMVLSLVTDFTGFLVLASIPFQNVSIFGAVTALNIETF